MKKFFPVILLIVIEIYSLTITKVLGSGFNGGITKENTEVTANSDFAFSIPSATISTTDYVPVSLGGSINVNPSGGAMYQLPILVSPGSYGMQPNLSIVYNSQAANSLLGYGWNLTGLSSIQLVNKSPYFESDDEQLTRNDIGYLALDGVRLIKLDPQSNTYHPANNPYIRVEYSDETFTVTTQDGVIMQYGNTADSKVKAVQATEPYAWALNRITDQNGNYIDFVYYNDVLLGENRISEIKYTGNSSSGKLPYNSVKFFYGTRNDPSSYFVFGYKVTRTSILTGIKVYCEGVVSKDYTFTYENDFYSRLKTINLESDGVKYAPTTINWNQTNSVLGIVSNAGMGTLQSGQSYFGDFNGDGKSDRAVFGNDGDIKVYFYNNATPKVVDLPDDEYTSLSNGYIQKVHNVKSVDIFDGDNDGKDDIFIHTVYTYYSVNNIDNTSSLRETNYINSYIFDQNTSTFTNTQIGFLSNFLPNINEVEPNLTKPDDYRYFFADINQNESIEKIIVKNKTFDGFSGITINSIPSITGISEVKLLDFNGNGRTDMLFLSSNGSGSIWEVSGNELINLIPSTSLSSSSKYFFPGDFNGDGKTDYLGRNASGWFMKYSTGFAFVDGVLPDGINSIEVSTPSGMLDYGQTIGQTPELYDIQKQFIPALAVTADDINNDGLSDLIYARYNNLYIYLNKGASFENAATVVMSTVNYPSNSKAPIVLYSLDLNSDGQKEIIYGNSNYYLSSNIKVFEPFRKVTFNSNLDNGFTVESISDGLEGNTTFTYSNFTDFEPFNTERPKPAYPLMLVRGPIKVVSKLKTVVSSKTLSEIDYTYADAYMHLQGLGFLGFKNVVSNNTVNSLSQETFYSLEVPSAAGVYSPWLSKTVVKKGLTPLTMAENTLSTLGGNVEKKCFLPVENTSAVTDYLKGITSNTTNSYNALLGRISVQNVSVGPWSTNTAYTFETVSGTSSRLVAVNTTRSNVDDTFTHSIGYTYSSTFPFRAISKTEQGITTNFNTFDSYGNVTKVTIGERVNSYTYDSKGRFALSTTDYTGLTSSKTYRSADGAVLSETNPNGLKVQITYEVSGGSLITKKLLPDGNIITSTLAHDNSGNWNYSMQESVTNGNTVTAYYNFAGQKIKETSKGYRAVEHSTLYEYSSKGLLTSEQSSKIPTATIYSYDNLDRLSSISGHNGLTVAYEYGSNYVKTTSSVTGAETQHFDAIGNTTKVSAPTGTVEYKYFASCKVKEILAAGAKTEMIYDNLGNQIILKDPSSGKTVYTYNIYNELTSQTDAKGQTIAVTYENGRVKSKTGTGITETYTYGSSIGKLGLIQSVDRNGVKEVFGYDNLGRPTSSQTTGAGFTFTTTYSYNSKGQLEYITYPTGLKVKYVYDLVGNLEKIYNCANLTSPIWFGNSKNGSDQWEKISLGNGLVTSYAYNNTTLKISGIKTGTQTSPFSVQNLGFAFNAKGQLTERTQGALQEQFTYDAMNRLTQSTVNGQQPVNIVYASNGNITSASTTGKYTYLTDKPFAVIKVTGVTGYTEQSPALVTNSTYTTDNKILEIKNEIYRSVFTYGPSGNRFKVDTYWKSEKLHSKIYVNNNELVLNSAGAITTSRTLIYAPTGICAVYEKNGSAPGALHYVHTDYLGSWLAITDSTGTVEDRYSYDAWGRPRNPDTWEPEPIDIANALASLSSMQPRFDRGYTGHEHMYGFGLINMNGRLYDPYLQRFLSPDPYVQNPGNVQNFNRYSYVLNNPLMFTDPTGYEFKRAINDAPIEYGNVLGDMSLYSNQRGAFSSNNYMSASWWNTNTNPMIRIQEKALWYSEHIEGILAQSVALAFHSVCFWTGPGEPQGQGGDPNGFDINKAVAYLISTAFEISKGRCSPHVVAALIEGGLTSLKGVPIKAGGSYGPLLTELGFTMISTTLDNYTPMKGDIAVIQGYSGGTQCSAGPCGHIQMYSGAQWVSDFFQSRPFWPGQKYEDAKSYFEIYRWQ